MTDSIDSVFMGGEGNDLVGQTPAMAYEVAGGAAQLPRSPSSDCWSAISRRQPAVVLVEGTQYGFCFAGVPDAAVGGTVARSPLLSRHHRHLRPRRIRLPRR